MCVVVVVVVVVVEIETKIIVLDFQCFLGV